MTFGIDDVPAFAEDGWIGRDVRVGAALIRPIGNVGRCAVTTKDPDTGVPTFDTLGILQRIRGSLETTEPLPVRRRRRHHRTRRSPARRPDRPDLSRRGRSVQVPLVDVGTPLLPVRSTSKVVILAFADT